MYYAVVEDGRSDTITTPLQSDIKAAAFWNRHADSVNKPQFLHTAHDCSAVAFEVLNATKNKGWLD